MKKTITTIALCTLALALTAKPFSPTWESLKNVSNEPEWFKDAKLGIYTHWGPLEDNDVETSRRQFLRDYSARRT